jgi:hypothetical protein
MASAQKYDQVTKPFGRSHWERLGLGLREKQLTPAVRADVALDQFACIRGLKVDAGVAALAALRRFLIFAISLADLLLRRRLRDYINGCGRTQHKCRAGERRAA